MEGHLLGLTTAQSFVLFKIDASLPLGIDQNSSGFSHGLKNFVLVLILSYIFKGHTANHYPGVYCVDLFEAQVLGMSLWVSGIL